MCNYWWPCGALSLYLFLPPPPSLSLSLSLLTHTPHLFPHLSLQHMAIVFITPLSHLLRHQKLCIYARPSPSFLLGLVVLSELVFTW